MSDSIFEYINTGFSPEQTLAKPEAPPEKPFITIKLPEPKPAPEPQYKEIKINLEKPKAEEQPKLEVIEITKEEYYVPGQEVTNTWSKSPDKDSILENVNTGFGPEDTLSIPECPSVTYYRHLYKETYLSEFETPEDKAKARENLQVYSQNEVDKAISDYVETRIEDFLKSLNSDIDLNFTKGDSNYNVQYNQTIRQLSQLGVKYIPLTEDRAVYVNSENLRNSQNNFPDLGVTTLTVILQELLRKIQANSTKLEEWQESFIDKYSGITAHTVTILDQPITVTCDLNWINIYGT